MTLPLSAVAEGQATTRPSPVLCEFAGPPAFAFLGWEGVPKSQADGLCIQTPKCQGGAGYNLGRDLSAYADRTPTLTLTVGKNNKAKSLRVHLIDADGTVHEYILKLPGAAVGRPVTILAEDGASLKEPSSVGEPGKTPGFDLTQIAHAVLVGDWSAEAIDVTIRRLELVEPDETILKSRQALRARLARQAEERRNAQEQQARRKKDLLGGAPHPADGPQVLQVGAVATDVLWVSIQEKEFISVPQVPYEPRDGDQIKHAGDETVLVIEDGNVLQMRKDVSVIRKINGADVKLGDLAVNARRIKPEDVAKGQDLTTETVDEPAAYRVTSSDDPDWQPVAPLQVWWKRKPNSFRSMTFAVEVFLKLPKAMAEGKTYCIEFTGVNCRQAFVDYRHEPAKTRSPAVHVSAVGFRPDDPAKIGFLSQWLGTGGAQHYRPGLRFHVLDDAGGKSVFQGPVTLIKAADANESFKAARNYSKTDVLGMDFSAFAAPGRYRLYVQGIGCSYPFVIADDAWAKAFGLSMKGLLHHRSGIELGPPFTDYIRPRDMHPADGAKVFASTASEIDGVDQDGIFLVLAKGRTERLLPEAWGGHKDAGDWDRNTSHPAAMWFLVDLYELFPDRIGTMKLSLPAAEANNAIPDILDEVLWNLDLYRRLQAAEGGVGGGIESTSHPRPGEASWQESLVLSAFAPDPRASFTYAATAAKLARALAGIDKRLSETYAASARKAWVWACAHSDEAIGRLGEKNRPAMKLDFRDRRNLAAFELWRLTGEDGFHEDFRSTTLLGDPKAEIARQLKAVTSYVRLPQGQGEASLRDAARKWTVQAADTALAFARGNAFGITTCIPGLPPIGFVGYLSTPEMVVGPVLPHAWLLTGEQKYLAGAVRACQFACGANPDNRALTTGLGPNPVRFPLHVDSQITGQPAPVGITVYGMSDPAENYGFDAWAHTWFLQKMTPPSRAWPTHESYWDIWVVPSTNEYTIHQTITPTAFYWGFLAARSSQ